VIAAVRRAGSRFSVTAPVSASVRAAIAGISEDAWQPVRCPRAIWDDQLSCWASDAEVAETDYTAFTSKKKDLQVAARLIVRRVRDLSKAAPGQGELFPAWRCHAVFTGSPFELVQAEAQHRGHAVVEQVFADWNDGPLAHLPSGRLAANAAWLVIAAMAFNLVRAAGALASLPLAKARAATIRRDLVAVAARTARHGRGHLTLHLPQGWHRETEWLSLFEAACGPPPQRPDQPRPGPHPHAARQPAPQPRPQAPDKPQNRQRREKYALKAPADENHSHKISRWIEA
jgi:Transposase DDE domain group 1